MNTPAMGPPLPRPILDRVESLSATTEYVACLIEIIGDTVRDLKAIVERGSAVMRDAGEWRQIEILLNLTSDQNEIVAQAVRDFAEAWVTASRPFQ